MKDTSFVWNQYQDQIYDLPQDIELTDEDAVNFWKKNGSSFTLHSSATFTMRSNSVIDWGWGTNEEPRTKIHIKEGRFVLKDEGSTTQEEPKLIVERADLLVDNASFLVDSPVAMVIYSNNHRLGGIALSEAGRYHARCWKHSLGDSLVAINGMASMHIDAEIFDCFGTTIHNASSADQALLLKSTHAPASERFMYFSESTIRCGAASKSLIASVLTSDDPKGSTIEFENTTIEVDEQADLHIKTDTPSVDAQCRFQIGLGSPTLRFTAYTKGHSPFDFIHHTYHPAIFDFARADGGQNKGQLMIETGASVFQFNAMMAQGAVTINGQPADPRDLTWKPLRSDGVDYFVVALEDKPR